MLAAVIIRSVLICPNWCNQDVNMDVLIWSKFTLNIDIPSGQTDQQQAESFIAGKGQNNIYCLGKLLSHLNAIAKFLFRRQIKKWHLKYDLMWLLL